MKRFYFPKNIYDALKQNPDLPIKDIQHITNCARSTAYRYKSNYNLSITEKIYEEILKNPDDFWNSDAGKSLYNDKFNLNKDKTENNI